MTAQPGLPYRKLYSCTHVATVGVKGLITFFLCIQVNSSSSSDDVISTFWLSNPCSSFDFFYNTVFIGTLSLLGITANLLSIVVLCLDRNNRVATFLLRSLAVADISVLVTVIVVMSIFFGTHSVPGFYVQHTRYAIPYLKKVHS